MKQAKLTHISIHAPPRGATLFVQAVYQCQFISIHAPPRGATKRGFALPPADGFQFTPLREGRRDPHTLKLRFVGFQFTPLREGRLELSVAVNRFRISIHAPPRGATHIVI